MFNGTNQVGLWSWEAQGNFTFRGPKSLLEGSVYDILYLPISIQDAQSWWDTNAACRSKNVYSKIKDAASKFTTLLQLTVALAIARTKYKAATQANKHWDISYGIMTTAVLTFFSSKSPKTFGCIKLTNLWAIWQNMESKAGPYHGNQRRPLLHHTLSSHTCGEISNTNKFSDITLV